MKTHRFWIRLAALFGPLPPALLSALSSALSSALFLALGWAGPAAAVPSYARQTGAECAACHIGAYGPHLTPFGIRFKLGGYTDSDGKSGKLPLAAQFQVTYTKPTTSNPALGGGKSDTRLSESDLYIAGRWFEGVGSYIRLQHLEGPTTTRQTALSDVDIRYAHEDKLGSGSLQWGLSFNKNPGIQDPLDVLPAWGFGAAGPGRDGVTGTRTGTLLNRFQGGLADRVFGVSAYGYLNSHWYGELTPTDHCRPHASRAWASLPTSRAATWATPAAWAPTATGGWPTCTT